MNSLRIGLLALVFLTMAFAVTLVSLRHDQRESFRAWTILTRHANTLEVEWGRLQLESASLQRPERLETYARQQLNMYAINENASPKR